ncbi:cell division initiation protein [Streptomyces sp. TRM 70351]|uniref:cell division initiation protein n=1 Tax=Streptomyces sp. TRM 70351 TaxID=3116552 RepID=UPI002E7B1D28|nr:cell division initiation protein [Streptomyces sp. TRM 70351]MEE1931162.1 cell division initiation protein [Streptomyces sp. TRM 70351]
MDVQLRLDDIVAAVRNARAMPMSASCVVNRAELLGRLEELREALPGSLAQAQELLGGREQMVADAREEAQRIIEAARSERGSLVSGTEVARRSQEEADRILAEARQEAAQIRAEADDYVDSKLANFEVVLSKTIDSVGRGKDKLLGRVPGEDAADDEPERPADPGELRERADAYVEAQFRAFEAVLTKTLDAVGRGRTKLSGHRPIDELGAHLAAQDEAGAEDHHRVHVTDAEYLAGLAEPQADAPPPADRPDAAPGPAQSAPGAQPQDASSYAPAPSYAQGGYEQGGGYADGTYQQGGYQQGGYAQDGYGYGGDGYGQSQQDHHQQGYPPQPGAVPHDPYAGQPDPYAGQHATAQGGYAQDGYAPQGYPEPYGQGAPYPPEQGYAGQDGYPPQPGGYPSGQQPGTQPLDETSLFDTSMIDMDQLRRYEQGR